MNTESLPSGFPMPRADVACLSMSEAVEELERIKALELDDPAAPSLLAIAEVRLLENVFQVRGAGYEPRHIEQLADALRLHGSLDPILVWRCGGTAFLLDGHHRLAAYQHHQRTTGNVISIPVVWFSGSALEAIVEASRDNVKSRLTMTKEQCSDHAWRLTVLGKFTISQIVAMSNVSPAQVSIMRKAVKELKEADDDPSGYASWMKARLAWKGAGNDEPMNEDEREEWLKMTAEKMASQIRPKLPFHRLEHNPELAAAVLDVLFGRRSPEIIEKWMDRSEHLSGYEPEGDEPEF